MITKFDKFFENRKYEYGCSMVYFDMPFMEAIQKIIDTDDVYEIDDKGYGFEDEPHVTLLFGLHDEQVTEEEIFKSSMVENIGDITLCNLSAFENEEYDVLKFDVEGDWLHEANDNLTKLPHTTDYPDYHPHCTIAYLKSGTAKNYIDLFKNVQLEITPKEIVYSKPNKEKIRKKVN